MTSQMPPVYTDEKPSGPVSGYSPLRGAPPRVVGTSLTTIATLCFSPSCTAVPPKAMVGRAQSSSRFQATMRGRPKGQGKGTAGIPGLLRETMGAVGRSTSSISRNTAWSILMLCLKGGEGRVLSLGTTLSRAADTCLNCGPQQHENGQIHCHVSKKMGGPDWSSRLVWPTRKEKQHCMKGNQVVRKTRGFKINKLLTCCEF